MPIQKRLDKDIEDIIQSVLKLCKGKRRYRTTKDVYLMVVNRIAEENLTRPSDIKLKLPGKTTIYRRIRESGIDEILRRRKSRIEFEHSGC